MDRELRPPAHAVHGREVSRIKPKTLLISAAQRGDILASEKYSRKFDTTRPEQPVRREHAGRNRETTNRGTIRVRLAYVKPRRKLDAALIADVVKELKPA